MTPVTKLLVMTAGISVAAYFGARLLCEYAKEQAWRRDIDQIYKNAGAA